MKKKIQILIVDDHFIVRIGLMTSLGMYPDVSVVAEASTGEQAIELYRQHRPDIVLMDVRLPDISGIEAVAAIRKEFPEAKAIMISTYDGTDDIHRSFQAGAGGYILKDVLGEELIKAIKTVSEGGQYIPPGVAQRLAEPPPGAELTERELQVLQLLIKGLSNKEIGDILGFTENTAKFHLKNILGKLHVSDRTEAATVAFQRGIVR